LHENGTGKVILLGVISQKLLVGTEY